LLVIARSPNHRKLLCQYRKPVKIFKSAIDKFDTVARVGRSH
jgi:hypothetical protein